MGTFSNTKACLYIVSQDSLLRRTVVETPRITVALIISIAGGPDNFSQTLKLL